MLPTRRRFLEGLGQSGAALAAGSWLSRVGPAAAAPGPARATLSRGRIRADLDRRLLGAFLEHLGRAIYTGVYEPGSKLADANGFRKDVIAEVKGLDVPIMRYPGGNFVSGYNWLDGVGPKDKRPTVLERAWNSLETNQFGTNEFIDWCKLVEHRAAARLQPRHRHAGEWPSPTSSTATSTKAPSGATCGASTATSSRTTCKYWCLGNEMDGPWQMGHMTAREYGRKARDCRAADPGDRPHAAADRLRLEQHDPADVPGVGSRGARRVLRPGRWHLAAQLLRQHAAADRQQHAPATWR